MIEKLPRVRRGTSRGLLLLIGVVGCAAVPKNLHEESRQQIIALRAELAQSQNQLAKLRTQNREIVARAVEDARLITSLEETNARLEESVLAYQDEREEYARSLREIKQKVLASATTPQASTLGEALDTFVADHPGMRHDAGSSWVAIRAGDLFERGSEAITPKGRSLLHDLSAVVIRTSPSSKKGLIAMASKDSAVKLTSTETRADLSAERFEQLIKELGQSSVREFVPGEPDPEAALGDGEWVRIDFASGSAIQPRS